MDLANELLGDRIPWSQYGNQGKAIFQDGSRLIENNLQNLVKWEEKGLPREQSFF